MRWDESGRDDNGLGDDGLDESGPYDGGAREDGRGAHGRDAHGRDAHGRDAHGRDGYDAASPRPEALGPLTSPWGVWSGPGVADVPGAARRAAAREAAAAGPPRPLPRWRVPGGAARAVLVVVGLLAVLLAVRANGSGGEVAGLGAVSRDPAAHTGHDATHEGTGSRAPGPARSPSANSTTGPASAGDGSTGAPGGPAGLSAGGPALVVHVVGRVRRPGTARLAPGSRVEDALRAAGGVASGADLTALNLARPVQDGEQVHVPRPGELPCGPAGAAPGTPGSSGGGAAGTTGSAPVDLNTADLSALDGLPGIGPVLAERIVAWRTEHGRFTSVDELGEVSGIGESLLSRLRPLVRV